MDILVLGSGAFEGIRRRQQQLARGLAATGHRVLFLEPPVEVPGADEAGAGDESGIAPAAPSEVTREVGDESLRPIADRLWVFTVPAPAAEGREGAHGELPQLWERWRAGLRAVLERLADHTDPAATFAGGLGDGPPFTPARVIVYHPAVIPVARSASPAPLLFDCVADFPALARSASAARAYQEAMSAGLPLLDGFVAVNRYILGSWGRLLAPGVPSAVIEHGVDLDLFRPPDADRRRAAREELALPADALVAAYLGRFDARLSYEDLRWTLDLEPDLRLLILGEVSSVGAASLQRLPPERLVTTDVVHQAIAARLVAAADLLLIPLRREPNLEPVRGLKLYEYLATGLPVVASFRRGIKAFRDLLYLYTTREELAGALRDARREPADGPQCRRRVATAHEAGWDERVRELLAFLERMPTGRPAPGGAGPV